MHPTPTPVPIFIVGICQRSGTNYLADLLRLHPDCAAPVPLWEDHVLDRADLLRVYVRNLCEHWSVQQGGGFVSSFRTRRPAFRGALHPAIGPLERTLCTEIGAGILATLQQLAGSKRLVTKTPAVRNLHLFPDLFPHAKLVLLVRDGRSVVESGMQSFGWPFSAGARLWAAGAQTILNFLRGPCGGSAHLIRYEDLVVDPAGRVRELLRYLDLDPSRYDFERTKTLPIRGSSQTRMGEQLHWNPVPRSTDFRPLTRWESWSRCRHERFNWIAGRYLEPFGYEARTHLKGTAFWILWNRLLDLWDRFRIHP